MVSSTRKVIKNERGRSIEAMIDSLNHTKSRIVINTNIIVCVAVPARFS
jgi:hypothetical protein